LRKTVPSGILLCCAKRLKKSFCEKQSFFAAQKKHLLRSGSIRQFEKLFFFFWLCTMLGKKRFYLNFNLA